MPNTSSGGARHNWSAIHCAAHSCNWSTGVSAVARRESYDASIQTSPSPTTPGVEFLGQVDDSETLYRRARVFVEATRSGGGTKLKVLNSLARGLPIAASPEAVAGLDVTPGEHLLVASDSVSLAASVVSLLTDEALWGRLSENG